MGKIHESIEELVGNTPLVRLRRVSADANAEVLVKLEAFNPFHSVKDRIGLSMIDTAEKAGEIEPGKTVLIEATSGNTGIGLAFVAASRGYRVIFTMPESMSIERRKMFVALGAECVLTEASGGMKGAIHKAEELAAETPNGWIPSQFDNPANPQVHYDTTGPEIWRDTDGNIDILVAGVGTGGTVTGTSRFLKEQNPNINVVVVEPDTSPVLSGGSAGPHKIQGIGAGFIPNVLNVESYDEVYQSTLEEAISTSRALATQEGIFVGLSSGAIASAALAVASRPENEGKRVVAILPDFGERYFSTVLFE